MLCTEAPLSWQRSFSCIVFKLHPLRPAHLLPLVCRIPSAPPCYKMPDSFRSTLAFFPRLQPRVGWQSGSEKIRPFAQVNNISLDEPTPWDETVTFGSVLIEPTIIYVPQVLRLVDAVDVHGLVHITGGGFPENIPRIVPKGCATLVNKSSWEVPKVFRWVQEKGKVAEAEMFRTFNMGVGMIVVVDAADVNKALAAEPSAFVLGEIVQGEGVMYKD